MKLKLKNFAILEHCELEIGDLNFFVGEQGTGKSLVLQLLKLIRDKKFIRKTLENHGFRWGDANLNLEHYFGEGMSELWDEKTEVIFENSKINKSDLEPKRRETYQDSVETIFYIPAQRILTLEDGWPKFFTNYATTNPFVLRHFSESMRQLLEEILSNKQESNLFPIPQRIDDSIRNLVQEHIYGNKKLTIEASVKKNLRMEVGSSKVPFMTWSAGQKEFLPFLLSIYYLCPPSRTAKKGNIDTVIIEEPEMGLHLKAILTVIIQILEFLSRGYRVIVSTHSSVFLEFHWVMQELVKEKSEEKFRDCLYTLFSLRRAPKLDKIFSNLKTKQLKTYYFQKNNQKVKVVDISELSLDGDTSWGGLLEMSNKATEIVSRINNEF